MCNIKFYSPFVHLLIWSAVVNRPVLSNKWSRPESVLVRRCIRWFFCWSTALFSSPLDCYRSHSNLIGRRTKRLFPSVFVLSKIWCVFVFLLVISILRFSCRRSPCLCLCSSRIFSSLFLCLRYNLEQKHKTIKGSLLKSNKSRSRSRTLSDRLLSLTMENEKPLNCWGLLLSGL